MVARCAIVTGAGTGIGREAAIALGERGYRLALIGRRRGPLEETRDLLGGPDEHLVLPGDVSIPEQVNGVFGDVLAAFGRIDLLFNNAGTGGGGAIDQLTVDEWRRVVDVNLTGMFLCLQAAYRAMKAQVPQGGRIINNGSLSAFSPRPNSIAYTATKHAVTGMTKAASLDGRAFGIACGQIDIGNAASAMTARIAQGAKQASGAIAPEPVMDPVKAGEAIAYMDSLPLDANVQFMTLMATTMPFIGRG